MDGTVGGLQSELDPGENILWQGRPSPERAFRSGIPNLIAGLVVGTGFLALLCYYVAFQRGSPPLLVFLIIVAVPALFGATRWMFTPFRNRRRATQSLGVVTDRRAIVFDQEQALRIQSFGSGLVAETESSVNVDGTGDILFPAYVWLPRGKARLMARAQAPDSFPRRGFRGIENGSQVRAFLDQAATSGTGKVELTCAPVDFRSLDLPARFADALRNVLLPGEDAFWVGSPARACARLMKWWPLVPAGVLFAGCGLALAFAPEIFAHYGVSLTNYPLFVRITGAAFGCAGLFVGFLPLREYGKLQRTVYAVSDRRALILEVRDQPVVQSFGPNEVRDYFRRERRDGSGDLVLQVQLRLERTKRGASAPGPEVGIRVSEVGFTGIRDVRAADKCLRALLAGQAARHDPGSDMASQDS